MKTTVLKGGNIIDVSGKKIFEGDIHISDGLIQAVIPGGEDAPEGSEVIDITGKYVSPGFIDAHIHIESSMLSPLEFAAQAVLHGTTAALVDPHEITNVFGLKAIELFLDAAEHAPMDILVGIPSCVPATDMENSGAAITLDDVTSLMTRERVYGLAEMMNFPGIIHGFGDAREKVDAVYDYGKIVDGHCPGLGGNDLRAYVSNGKNDGIVRIMSDHETTSAEEAMEKLDAGMYIAVRYGSATRDLDAILPGLLKNGVSLERCMLCSDDLSPAELLESGHVDRIIKRARDIIIEETGANPEDAAIQAISMATLHPARYLERYLDFHGMPFTGEIARGRKANLVIMDSLEELSVNSVMHRGEMVVFEKMYTAGVSALDYRDFTRSINLDHRPVPADFAVTPPVDEGDVTVRAIEIIPGSLLTRALNVTVKAAGGRVNADHSQDLAKVAVFERHHATGSRALGFIKGLGLSRGAVASTIAHDSHNLIVAGMDDTDMARAANHLYDNGGGMVIVHEDEVLFLPLAIGGLMSTERIGDVVEGYTRIKEAARASGTGLENIFMTLAFTALPVIPELRITDKGLVDVNEFRIVPLFPEDDR